MYNLFVIKSIRFFKLKKSHVLPPPPHCNSILIGLLNITCIYNYTDITTDKCLGVILYHIVYVSFFLSQEYQKIIVESSYRLTFHCKPNTNVCCDV